MEKLSNLQRNLKQLERVVVAFSGGVDSALLAWVALEIAEFFHNLFMLFCCTVVATIVIAHLLHCLERGYIMAIRAQTIQANK